MLSALLCVTAFGFLEESNAGESLAAGVTFDAPLPYNCAFVSPTDGETVSGTYLIDFYGDYSGSSLYRVRIRLYKGSTGLTSYYDMTSVGGGHWQINWNTENYADGTGYRLRAVAYRTSSSYTNVYCDDLTIDNEGGGPPPGPGELRSGVTAHSSLGGTGQTEMWYIDVPSGITTMRTVLTCGSADFDVYGRRGAEPTTSTYDWRGYTSGGEDVTINNPSSGRWYIMVRSYSGSGNYDLTCTLSEGPSPGQGEKIAVFFWASDAGAQWVIDKYTTILRGEGYTKFFNFRDSYSPSSDCSSVDAYEDSQDTIFVYVF
ncbi:MAG: PPC domain-containing protein, partial [Candidatus Hodarchaeota archaeon]